MSLPDIVIGRHNNELVRHDTVTRCVRCRRFAHNCYGMGRWTLGLYICVSCNMAMHGVSGSAVVTLAV